MVALFNFMEKRFIITRQNGDKTEYLMHRGHEHLWTSDRSLAMEYTRLDVAEGLAKLYNGAIKTA